MPKIPLTAETRFAIHGRIVTMDDQSTVINKGVLYIKGDRIEHVRDESQQAPQGWTKSNMIKTGGTIYPGLIELHNHLSYNIIKLWDVPKQYSHHSQWKGHKEYQKYVTGPMKILGETDGYIQSIVRYVECKLLFSGVTTSQGITLNSNAGIKKFYKGIVRNVEQTEDPDLKNAKARIADIANVTDAGKLRESLQSTSCYLLHLAEGVETHANKHFKALRIPPDSWAITESYCGIHALGLNKDDFGILKRFKGSMVWSPCSNLLLYGKTSQVEHAKNEGILIGLGSDWSPSGSKNLLCELKMAKIVSEEKGNLFSDEELVRMVTTNAARILKWDAHVGSLQANRKADLMVVDGNTGDPYQHLIESKEEDVTCVMINGLPRFGLKTVLNRFDTQIEEVKIGSRKRALYLKNESADNPIDISLTFKSAADKLTQGLLSLKQLAIELESGIGVVGKGAAMSPVFLRHLGQRVGLPAGIVDIQKPSFIQALTEYVEKPESGFVGGLSHKPHSLQLLSGSIVNAVTHGPDGHPTASEEIRWTLELDHCDSEESCLRHHVRYEGEDSGGGILLEAAVKYSDILEPMKLDPATIANDPDYFKKIAIERNLTDEEKQKLAAFYGAQIDLSESERYRQELDADVRGVVEHVKALGSIYQMPGKLNLEERVLIVDQAITLLRDTYVHLHHKEAMHASNPLMRLEILKNDLLYGEYMDEILFHKYMIEIFNSLRDLHTSYLLPRPYQEMVAFLPFMVEEFFDEQKTPRYIASKKFGVVNSSAFNPGVEIISWNGIPIRRAITINGHRFAGSNKAARFARGLDSLTLRPLAMMLPPEEEKVYLEFRDPKPGKRLHRVTIPWRIASIYSKTIQEMQRGADMMTGTALGASGYDFMTQLVHIAKKHFIVPGVAKREAEGVEQSPLSREFIPGFEEPLFLNHLKTKKCVYDGTEYGYIRVYSFDVEDDQAFAKDFKRLVDTAPKAGLIIDLRNNGGGNILAAECMLQSLSTKLIDPAPAQFINRPLVEYLLKMHSPSQRVKGLDLTNWNDRLRVMRQTGSTYSLAFPMTPVELLGQYQSSEKLNVVLITDALCYSATDIFAAGFQDHELGEVLGVHENTGAGGANVWTHWILNMLTTDDQSSPYFTKLPYGADMRVAVRRMLRVGKNAGIPLEDLGVVPTYRHEMTRTDLLESNKDLIAHACRILST